MKSKCVQNEVDVSHIKSLYFILIGSLSGLSALSMKHKKDAVNLRQTWLKLKIRLLLAGSPKYSGNKLI